MAMFVLFKLIIKQAVNSCLKTDMTNYLSLSGLSQLCFVEESVKQYLITQYTEQGPRTSRDTGILTNRMRDKILASLLIMGLMLNGYTLNTDVLQRDLKAQSAKYVLTWEKT